MGGEGALRLLFETFVWVIGVWFDFVEADGGFEHEEHIEALLADVSDNPGDVLRLGDRLVNGLTELLDQVFDFLIQCHLRVALVF